MNTTTNWPPTDWETSMHAELHILHALILRVGMLAAGMDSTPEERTRLSLCANETAQGACSSPAIEELRQELRQIARGTALAAQAAVSRAMASPDDPRHAR
jgi:hypothetical protein